MKYDMIKNTFYTYLIIILVVMVVFFYMESHIIGPIIGPIFYAAENNLMLNMDLLLITVLLSMVVPPAFLLIKGPFIALLWLFVICIPIILFNYPITGIFLTILFIILLLYKIYESD